MIEIIRLNESHVAPIAAIEKQCFSAPWDEASVRSEITNPLALWLVAVEDGQVLGYVGSQTVLREADMMNVAVAAAYRRRGIAAKLFAQVEGWARERGAVRLELHTWDFNQGAIAMYRDMGMTPQRYVFEKKL